MALKDILLQTFLAGLVGLMVWTGAARAAPESARETVVYHIGSGDPVRQRSVLRSIGNHLDARGDGVLQIEVVLQGDGVTLGILPETGTALRGPQSGNATQEMQTAITKLQNRGVHFAICGSSLQRRGVDGASLTSVIGRHGIVPSGLAELVRLQEAGFIYINP